MVCYIVPLVATVIGSAHRKASGSHDAKGMWLNIMLLGGALFGLIDHAWNAELFLISANWMLDLALGATITTGIFVSWGVIAFRERLLVTPRFMSRRTGALN
ncbi:MAG: hypothetical protein JXC85_01940 [Candidatus Aenigmarchaeota archaeon]|nr:hypothetical protein [Candidatus Aenigmarchaeota archaeon]